MAHFRMGRSDAEAAGEALAKTASGNTQVEPPGKVSGDAAAGCGRG